MTENRNGNGLVKALVVLAICGGGAVGYLKWKKLKDEEEAARSRPVTFAQQFQDALKELKKTDLKQGEGAEAVYGAKVTIHYVGMLQDGTVFDSSITRNQPVSFPLGVAQALPAWDQGIIGMRVGGRRKLESPPFLAYGQSGIAGLVPPNAPVVFEIDLLKVGEADDPITKKNREIENKTALANREHSKKTSAKIAAKTQKQQRPQKPKKPAPKPSPTPKKSKRR
ncbi:MAG: FKBP-type peptidyl-prolyl cis-trans isomerase [Bdellovibrionales bacterium]|nr:FKBP-type peptidyl-prolyl cis-trans isomerase [Bdellovibrionales bacterium]